jgi:mersacidin/lichenicidin family type 2 lantibiotic
MTREQIIRAWKDESYRAGLDAQHIAALPLNSAGFIELGNDELEDAAGASTLAAFSFGCCSTGFLSWFTTCTGGCDVSPSTESYACKPEMT